MPFIPFGEFRPDVDDFRGEHTQVLSGALPRGDGYGPMPNLQAYSIPLASGNDSFTKILLHLNGTNASTTFPDTNTGGSAHTWTAAGNAQITTGDYKFGGSSALFDGVGDYITTPDSVDFTLGAGAFTIDTWFKCLAAGGAVLWIAGQCNSTGTTATTSFTLQRTAGNVIKATMSDGAALTTVTGTTQFTNALNTGWHHLALVRTGNILRLFLDGVQEGGDVAFTATVNDSANQFSVGRPGEQAGNEWNGNMDEFRLSVGIARWTANFTPPQKLYDTAVNGSCRGLFYARKTDGTIAVFAATSTRLFQLNNTTLDWIDVSLGGLAYSAVPTTDQWQFAQFGTNVIAVQANTVPQVMALAGTAFANLGGSPPTSRYVAVVGRFLVLSGNVSVPNRVAWSDLDGITTWTPGTGFANTVDLPDGGVVRGIAGGEFGLVLQESVTRKMTYVSGAKPAFALERVAEEKGLLGAYSIVRAGERVLYVSPQGFQMFYGGALTPIGKERVDRSFFVLLDQGNLQMLLGSSDPGGTRAFWAFKSQAASSTTLFDTMICYDYLLDRWSPFLSITGEFLAPITKPGLTLDGIDQAYGTNIDTINLSSLDAVQSALNARLSGVTTNHQLGFFDGLNLEAILETAEQGDDARRMFISGIKPRTDAPTVYGSIRHRANAQSTLQQTGETLINAQGRCPQHRDTSLARARIRIPAGTLWNNAMGTVLDAFPTGQR
jgi:hypothetical protein